MSTSCGERVLERQAAIKNRTGYGVILLPHTIFEEKVLCRPRSDQIWVILSQKIKTGGTLAQQSVGFLTLTNCLRTKVIEVLMSKIVRRCY